MKDRSTALYAALVKVKLDINVISSFMIRERNQYGLKYYGYVNYAE